MHQSLVPFRPHPHGTHWFHGSIKVNDRGFYSRHPCRCETLAECRRRHPHATLFRVFNAPLAQRLMHQLAQEQSFVFINFWRLSGAALDSSRQLHDLQINPLRKHCRRFKPIELRDPAGAPLPPMRWESFRPAKSPAQGHWLATAEDGSRWMLTRGADLSAPATPFCALQLV